MNNFTCPLQPIFPTTTTPPILPTQNTSFEAFYLVISTFSLIFNSWSIQLNGFTKDVFGLTYICCSLWISGWVLWFYQQWDLQMLILYSLLNILASLSNYLVCYMALSGKQKIVRGVVVVLLIVNQSLLYGMIKEQSGLCLRLPIIIMKFECILVVLYDIVGRKLKERVVFPIAMQVVLFLMYLDCKMVKSYQPLLYYLAGFFIIVVMQYKKLPSSSNKAFYG